MTTRRSLWLSKLQQKTGRFSLPCTKWYYEKIGKIFHKEFLACGRHRQKYKFGQMNHAHIYNISFHHKDIICPITRFKFSFKYIFEPIEFNEQNCNELGPVLVCQLHSISQQRDIDSLCLFNINIFMVSSNVNVKRV